MPIMRDRTAQAEPLTVGQQLVARWESPNSGWGEPADLAEAIDRAIQVEREACARAAEEGGLTACQDFGMQDLMGRTADAIAKAIRARPSLQLD